MNRLAQERSIYLQHAAPQQIAWYPWSEEAFAAALREDKPVFLSSGAAWCHWCHVMAKESFDDPEIAELLNRLFVCIKLDRDERPDIDRRYQQAVAAMAGAGGWPLSVFLLPDKRAFFGGTYFPPEDATGRPGFRNVLKAVSDFYRTRKQDAVSSAGTIVEALRPQPLVPTGWSRLTKQRAQAGFPTRPKSSWPSPGRSFSMCNPAGSSTRKMKSSASA